jgi:hypothetical protein
VAPATLPRAGERTDNQSAASPRQGGGGGMKWVLIGGAVAGGGAAAALASNKSSPAAPPAPAVGDVSVSGLTDVLLAAANSVTFAVSGATAQGETLQATWSFGDGTTHTAAIANGNATATKTYTTAGVFVPRVTVSGSRGGSTTRDYRQVTVTTVTGRWTGRFTNINGTFTINLTQNGTQITGDAVDDFSRDQGRATGAVSGPPSAMKFRLNYADNTFYEIDVTGSSDQRTFTGTITGARSNPFVMIKQQ